MFEHISDGGIPILPVSVPEATKRCSPNVARDHIRGWEVAGPLFEAGGVMACLAHHPQYNGEIDLTAYHWFCLILHGEMEIQLGEDIFIAGPGDLACIPAGTMARRTGLGPVTWLYIQLDDVPMWSSLKTASQPVRKYESTDLMYILVCRIIGAHRSQDMYSIECAHENAKMLVTLLEREMRQSTELWSMNRMHKLTHLLDQIRENPQFEWHGASMARELCMSERNLIRVFKRTFDIPPARMVMTIRMERATKMLRDTDMTVTAIGNAVGYQSAFSFSRLFKSYVGTSPAKYRNQHRNN